MRIIRGRNKGRKIVAPENLPVRPTTDMAKESLFNILENNFDFSETTVLDLFSGTGNIAYEFVSRGCPDLTAVDNDRFCVNFIKNTVGKLNYSEIKVIQSDFTIFLKKTHKRWDLIFADPPYSMENINIIPELIFENGLLNENGWFIIEHDKNLDLSDKKGYFDQRKYGKVNFTFFRNDSSS